MMECHSKVNEKYSDELKLIRENSLKLDTNYAERKKRCSDVMTEPEKVAARQEQMERIQTKIASHQKNDLDKFGEEFCDCLELKSEKIKAFYAHSEEVRYSEEIESKLDDLSADMFACFIPFFGVYDEGLKTNEEKEKIINLVK